MTTWFRPYRWGGLGIKALKRIGVDVRPLADRELKIAGFRIRWREEEPGLLRGALVRLTLAGSPVVLFVENDIDVLQQHHRRGRLYEAEELEMIASAWRGGTFLDVGANVGNHTLYASICLGATKVIAVEPADAAADILDVNVVLNRLDERVEVHRSALSDGPGRASALLQSNNLGATRLSSGGGDIVLTTGDELVGDTAIDFVKIDTEGFEMRVLRGLIGVITRDRPALLVEVENDNLAAFDEFCADQGYEVIGHYRRYDTSINLLATQSDGG